MYAKGKTTCTITTADGNGCDSTRRILLYRAQVSTGYPTLTGCSEQVAGWCSRVSRGNGLRHGNGYFGMGRMEKACSLSISEYILLRVFFVVWKESVMAGNALFGMAYQAGRKGIFGQDD